MYIYTCQTQGTLKLPPANSNTCIALIKVHVYCSINEMKVQVHVHVHVHVCLIMRLLHIVKNLYAYGDVVMM